MDEAYENRRSELRDVLELFGEEVRRTALVAFLILDTWVSKELEELRKKLVTLCGIFYTIPSCWPALLRRGKTG